jgi:tetratricopeptide (TPR) repeat protein
LAELLRRQGKYVLAEMLFRQTVESESRVLGSEHPDTLKTMNGLGVALWRQDKYDEAEKIHCQTLQIQRRVLGEDHIDTLRSWTNVGTVLWAQGRIPAAEVVLRGAVDKTTRILGDSHPETLKAMNNLGLVLERQGHLAEAEKLYRHALETDERILGKEHPDTQIPLNNLVRLLSSRGKIEALRPFVRDQLERRRQAAQELSSNASAQNDYAWLLLTCEPVDLRDPETALQFAERAVELSKGKDPYVLDTLAVALQMTGNLDRAIQIEKQALPLAKPGTPWDRALLEKTLIEFLQEKGDTIGLVQAYSSILVRQLKERILRV